MYLFIFWLQKFSPLFCENKITKYERKFEAEKYHWSETKKRVMLVVRQHCISQVDYYEGKTLADYCYKDIQSLAMVCYHNHGDGDHMIVVLQVSDHPGGVIIIHGGFGRMVNTVMYHVYCVCVYVLCVCMRCVCCVVCVSCCVCVVLCVCVSTHTHTTCVCMCFVCVLCCVCICFVCVLCCVCCVVYVLCCVCVVLCMCCVCVLCMCCVLCCVCVCICVFVAIFIFVRTYEYVCEYVCAYSCIHGYAHLTVICFIFVVKN